MSRHKISFNVAEEKSARLAVLIDADNASAQSINAILEETAKFGEAVSMATLLVIMVNGKLLLTNMPSSRCSSLLIPRVKMLPTAS